MILYTFIIFADCNADIGLEMDGSNACVCVVGYYQTALGDADNPPTCTACPAGSTTTTSNSQSISDCGKNSTIIIPINWH